MAQRKNISGLEVSAGIGSVLIAHATVDTSVTNSTTHITPTGLFLQPEINATYIYTAFIIYSAGTTEDLNWAHTAPTGAAMRWTDPTNSFFASPSASNVWSGAGVGYANARAFSLDGWLKMGATSGFFNGRMAQAVSGANATVIYLGSWMRLERVA
ncbi:hypothetical protein [Streptomyces sp. NPDC006477]|uniref:hypothetical protein n=1 Tax=Streptomyces sp. NPDC006477 TaxID=3364747 RepID=UPI003697824C